MPYTKFPPYTFEKGGIFYFSRRVPSDISDHYLTDRIVFSLRTKSTNVASSRARKAADQLEEYWYHLRVKSRPTPGLHQLVSNKEKSSPASNPTRVSTVSVSLTEATNIYLRLKGAGKPKTFHRAAERVCGYVVEVCGNKPITEYTKADANSFRDHLLEKGLAGSSITRIFGTLRSMTNFAASEEGIPFTNPFTGVYFDRSAGTSVRLPVPEEALSKIQTQCRLYDDELRWIVALVSDTGLRLAEALGLVRDDFEYDQEGNLSVYIRPHPWRRLKTAGSERIVPLEGLARWAAEQALAGSNDSSFVFPRNNRDNQTNSNSASASLNKWLKPFVPDGCTMHSFRHSMRDRLRAVECPSDIVDQLGGWQTDGVGHSYGSGYPQKVLRKWIKTSLEQT